MRVGFVKTVVVGLGKIGLPLAVQFATNGQSVIGVDIDTAVVDAVNAAQVLFPGEEGLAEKLATVVTNGSLSATADYGQAVPGADVVVVVVPLVVDEDKNPDYDILDRATASIGEHISTGTLVAYETTLPVGTTRTRWKPALEAASGLTEGTDFHTVFSPERVSTGRTFADLRRYPKLLGALDAVGAQRAQEFYESVLTFDDRPDLGRPNGVWDLGSAEAAELAKLMETTYRDVNIGLANQFAMFAGGHGIDVHEVIAACNSQPFSHIHSPGVGVGGHCIPVYPHLYLVGDPGADIVSAARRVNVSMPRHAVSLLAKDLGDLAGRRVVVLGAAYRAGVKETAFSGVFPLVDELAGRGASPLVHDPLYSDDELVGLGFTPWNPGDPAEGAILHTSHPQYATLTERDVPGLLAVVDGRHTMTPRQFSNVALRTIGVGSPVKARPVGR